uniref:Ig-like domain-containing protein n=1 Tax=Cyprinus carpio TaxID=7962 RepID=A0A8C1N5A2_CYPCA
MCCCLFCIVGSCADPDVEVHKAVGDSLELIADYPKRDLEVQWKYNQTTFAEYPNDDLQKVNSELFNNRLQMNKNNISVTVTDLTLQDSGRFSIVAESKSFQYKTKVFVLHVHGSCADPDVEVHKAVGDSLELIADYPKDGLEVQWKYNQTIFAEYRNDDFQKVESKLFNRLKMKKNNISVTVTDLKLQDSGKFSVVAERKTSSEQYKTKVFELHVHDLIREVQIEDSYVWLQSKNLCMFHLRCVASGDPSPSYSWISPQTQGPQLNINLSLTESATLNCTANNTVSIKYTTKTVVCKSDNLTSGFGQEYVLIAAGVCIVAVVIFSGAVAVCCRWRKNKGQGESEDGITVYEDVNTDGAAKKRSESVVNGMTIYETVDDTKLSQILPQTLYDKISFQRHPEVSTSTSSPYQEVL